MDWLLRRLADRLGVMPAGVGESFDLRIRPEQPLAQGPTILVVIGCAALIVWLYRREGAASMPFKMTLAALRISLVLLALFMLSEAVLSVDRTGLPYFVVMVDDSASQQVVDQYADPKAKAAAAELAKVAGHPEPDRLALAQGFLAKDDGAILRELQKKHRVRLYLVSSAARPFARIDAPEQVAPALKDLMKVEASGEQSRLGSGIRQVLTELRGVPPTAIVLLTDGQTTEGRDASPRRPSSPSPQGRARSTPIGLGDPEPVSRPGADRPACRRRRVRRRPRAVRGPSCPRARVRRAGRGRSPSSRRRVPGSTDPNATKDLETDPRHHAA